MNFNAFDHQCMARALDLARKGLDSTHPNPRVGCVIANGGEIVGTGWHEKAGSPHAEVHALAEAAERAAGATAYVTLEPCSHEGRTPPCTAALIEAGVARVVCAHEDPNPEINGKGLEALRHAGIEVQCGLMANEARELNCGFIKRMSRHLPWVRIKLAQSMDGHIALGNGVSQWISGPQARADVQRWRARSDAVLTGIGTLLADDPSLNVRNAENARQPMRVLVDSRWRTPAEARFMRLPGKVLIAGLDANSGKSRLEAAGAECISLPSRDNKVDLQALLAELARREINEVQVEAGPTLCGALVQNGLVDEVLIYQAPVLLGGGALSPFAAPRLDNMTGRVHLEWVDVRKIGTDLRLRLKPVVRA